MNKEKEEEDNLEVETMEALIKAKKAFEEYLENLEYDPAYWDIEFNAYLVSSDFKSRLTKISLEHELKDNA